MAGLHKTWAASRATRAATGFRSGLEVKVAKELEAAGVDYMYEKVRVPYLVPTFYNPDFILTKQAIIVETKGHFPSADRSKMLRVKQQHPNLDIRFVFSRVDTLIGKKSKTTYAMWCKRNGFPYAESSIPGAWLKHNPLSVQKEALFALINES